MYIVLHIQLSVLKSNHSYMCNADLKFGLCKRVCYKRVTDNKYSRFLKLYCRYLYTRPCMINHIWGLKTTMTSGEWTCLISFATAPLTCSERGGSEKIQNENICLQRDSNPHPASPRQESCSALDRSATNA